MRLVALAVAGLIALTACGGLQEQTAEPAPDPGEAQTATATPETLEESTCENATGGDPANFPAFREVRIESGETDRISFLFEPESGAPDAPPLHFINFTDELITDGEGRPVRAEGEAFIVVSFQAVGVDLSGERPVEVYTGPKRFSPRLGVLREAVHLGDFEGQVSWGLGLSRSSCFALEAERDRITLEFPSA